MDQAIRDAQGKEKELTELISVAIDSKIVHKGDPMFRGQHTISISASNNIFDMGVVAKIFVVVTIEVWFVFRDARGMNLKDQFSGKWIIFSKSSRETRMFS